MKFGIVMMRVRTAVTSPHPSFIQLLFVESLVCGYFLVFQLSFETHNSLTRGK